MAVSKEADDDSRAAVAQIEKTKEQKRDDTGHAPKLSFRDEKGGLTTSF